MQARIQDWMSPDYTEVYRERVVRLKKIRGDPDFAEKLGTFYRTHPVEWIEDWAFTYDPRLPERNPFMPFMLFPRQRDFILWLWERYRGKMKNGRLRREDGVVEKSRDVGISWLAMSFAVWLWLWHPGAAIGVGSYEADKVDQLGVPGSLLEKCRIIIRMLPEEMKPAGLNEGPKGHLMHKRLVHPEKNRVIFGDIGDSIGRGDRSSIYIIDEAAHLEHPDMADASLSATSDCKIYMSSARGQGSFWRKVTGGAYSVFRFHWTEDPRKDQAWYEEFLKKNGPVITAQEVDIDHGASIEGIIIKTTWVDAARRIRSLISDWPVYIGGFGGMDVGGGSAKSVFISRFGPFVDPPVFWQDGDTTNTAHRGAQCARDHGVSVLNFDTIGIGAGVQSTLKRVKSIEVLDDRGRTKEHQITSNAVNVGQSPSDDYWPSGRTSRELFANLKAELWWKMRERFRATYEMVRWMETGGDEGSKHDLDGLIVLPAVGSGEGSDTLASQLSGPTVEYMSNGKLRVESKASMARRGLSSPDFAEALSLTFAPTPPTFEEAELEGWF